MHLNVEELTSRRRLMLDVMLLPGKDQYFSSLTCYSSSTPELLYYSSICYLALAIGILLVGIGYEDSPFVRSLHDARTTAHDMYV